MHSFMSPVCHHQHSSSQIQSALKPLEHQPPARLEFYTTMRCRVSRKDRIDYCSTLLFSSALLCGPTVANYPADIVQHRWSEVPERYNHPLARRPWVELL
eukprot:COSAG02_NODE_1872_length_10579_cov_4.937405_3_plen_100_part_00